MSNDEVGPIDLKGELAERVNRAGDDGKHIIVSYVDADGRPHVSIRGSVHVLNSQQLAMWIRDGYVGTTTPASGPKSGFLAAIEANPYVSAIYRHHEDLVTYVFDGRARIAEDQATRDQVYEGLYRGEKGHSPDRSGTAIVIDVDHVVGGQLAGGGVIASKLEMVKD